MKNVREKKFEYMNNNNNNSDIYMAHISISVEMLKVLVLLLPRL